MALPVGTVTTSLGVRLDSSLSMSPRLCDLVRTCHYHLRQIHSIRRSVSESVARLLVSTLVCSRLDYCNSLLFGTSLSNLKRLQSVLHTAARLILRRRRYDHITSGLRDVLPWLPVRERVVFKLCLLMFRCSRGSAPSYLAKYYHPVSNNESQRRLRSASLNTLKVPRTRTTYGSRSFTSAGPTVWNSLPPHLRDPTLTLSQFKTDLKSHLFRLAYFE